MTTLSKPNLQANKLRTLADKMSPVIDNKLNPAIAGQNMTPRRIRIARSIRKEGERLQRVQAAMRAVADLMDAGTAPQFALALTTKRVFEELLMFERVTSASQPERYGITDQAVWTTVREWLVALSIGQPDPEAARKKALREKEEELCGARIPGFFPTPQSVVEMMLTHAGLYHTHSILEPSAGSGAICDGIKQFFADRWNVRPDLDVIEINPTLRELLKLKGYEWIAQDFLAFPYDLQIAPVERYDRIVMNPPFENGQDTEHIQHADKLLKSDGRLVSIIGEGPFFRNDSKSQAFRSWLGQRTHYQIDLPAGAFNQAGLARTTDTKTRILVIDKPQRA